MSIRDDIATRIRVMRKSRMMTQEDLAKALGQSASSITMYETGRREPDFETLEALADIFNVSLFDLVSGGAINQEVNELVNIYMSLSEENRAAAMTYMKFLKAQEG